MNVKTLGSLAAVLALAFALSPAAQARSTKAKHRAAVQHLVLKVTNLTRSTKKADLKKLEKAVKKVRGVKSVAANTKKGELFIKHKPGADVAAIKKAVTDAGFTLQAPKTPAPVPAPAAAPDAGSDAGNAQ